MGEIDILKAQIVRQDLNQHWGFRLQGGNSEPLIINRILPGSPAARIGLKAGDEVTEIYGSSTVNMSVEEAMGVIDASGDSVILTVESNNVVIHRLPISVQIGVKLPADIQKARGSIPLNPVMQQEFEHPKSYQPMDMIGGPGRAPRRRPNALAYSQIVKANSFDGYPSPDTNSPRQQNFRPQTTDDYSGASSFYGPSRVPGRASSGDWTGPSDAPSGGDWARYANYTDDNIEPVMSSNRQSRSFKVLQSVMHNESPAAGEAGLPPPRSAAMEKQQRYAAGGRHPSGGRVKVFMPAQYNSPLGMYSADNVLETFTAQAENMLDNMERSNFRAVSSDFVASALSSENNLSFM